MMPSLSDGLRLESRLFYLRALVLLLLAEHCGGQSKVIGPSQPIEAFVGDDVILPCHLEPAKNVFSESVEWGRLDLEPRFVHVWDQGDNFLEKQNPSYQGRTSLSTENLKHGNLSLHLSAVTPSDNGEYRCYLPSQGKHATAKLIVGYGSINEEEHQGTQRTHQLSATNSSTASDWLFPILKSFIGSTVCCLLCVLIVFIVWKWKKSAIMEYIFSPINTNANKEAQWQQRSEGELNTWKAALPPLMEVKAGLENQRKELIQQVKETEKEMEEIKEKVLSQEKQVESERIKRQRYLEEKEHLVNTQEKLEKRKEEGKKADSPAIEMKGQLEKIEREINEIKEKLQSVEKLIAESETEKLTGKRDEYSREKESLSKFHCTLENHQLSIERQMQKLVGFIETITKGK